MLITTTTTILYDPLLQKGCKWRVVQCQDCGGAKLLDGKGRCAPEATPCGHILLSADILSQSSFLAWQEAQKACSL